MFVLKILLRILIYTNAFLKLKLKKIYERIYIGNMIRKKRKKEEIISGFVTILNTIVFRKMNTVKI